MLLAYVWWRIETSSGRERRAVLWLAVAARIDRPGLRDCCTFATEECGRHRSPSAVLFALIGPAMYVGATLPDLVDVRALVVTAVVFAVAVVTYMSLFVLVVALLEAIGADDAEHRRARPGRRGGGGQLRTRSRCALRGVVDELLFGVRLDPLGAASAVAGTGSGDDPVARPAGDP